MREAFFIKEKAKEQYFCTQSHVALLFRNFRNERIQSRVAKKRSRLASKEQNESGTATEDATEVRETSSVEIDLPPLQPLKKVRLDSEAMPPPSMYLASQALLYEKPEPMDEPEDFKLEAPKATLNPDGTVAHSNKFLMFLKLFKTD